MKRPNEDASIFALINYLFKLWIWRAIGRNETAISKKKMLPSPNSNSNSNLNTKPIPRPAPPKKLPPCEIATEKNEADRILARLNYRLYREANGEVKEKIPPPELDIEIVLNSSTVEIPILTQKMAVIKELRDFENTTDDNISKLLNRAAYLMQATSKDLSLILGISSETIKKWQSNKSRRLPMWEMRDWIGNTLADELEKWS